MLHSNMIGRCGHLCRMLHRPLVGSFQLEMFFVNGKELSGNLCSFNTATQSCLRPSCVILRIN